MSPEFTSNPKPEPVIDDSFTWQNPDTGEFFEVNLMSDGTQQLVSLEEDKVKE